MGKRMRKVVGVRAEQGDRSKTERLPWGFRTTLASHALSGSGVTLEHLLLFPGQTTDVHLHPDTDEACHLVWGNLSVAIGASTFLLKQGDTLTIPRDQAHQIKNAGKGTAEILQALSSGAAESIDPCAQAIRQAFPFLWPWR